MRKTTMTPAPEKDKSRRNSLTSMTSKSGSTAAAGKTPKGDDSWNFDDGTDSDLDTPGRKGGGDTSDSDLEEIDADLVKQIANAGIETQSKDAKRSKNNKGLKRHLSEFAENSLAPAWDNMVTSCMGGAKNFKGCFDTLYSKLEDNKEKAKAYVMKKGINLSGQRSGDAMDKMKTEAAKDLKRPENAMSTEALKKGIKALSAVKWKNGAKRGANQDLMDKMGKVLRVKPIATEQGAVELIVLCACVLRLC